MGGLKIWYGGVILAFLGSIMNRFAMSANGEIMPVLGIPSSSIAFGDKFHAVLRSPKLPWLCDWIGNQDFRSSPGDVILAMGVVLMISGWVVMSLSVIAGKENNAN
jgi:hypothetical protein